MLHLHQESDTQFTNIYKNSGTFARKNQNIYIGKENGEKLEMQFKRRNESSFYWSSFGTK